LLMLEDRGVLQDRSLMDESDMLRC